MSFDLAIRVSHLGKCYFLYDKPRDRLLQMLMRGYKKFYREFWALKDVSFEIKKGETVGVVGRNGSGKSTLLQLICGTLNPSFGDIYTNGRIAALLELGTGFNPEFTGRENVYMNGTLLGLSKRDIDTRFDDITEFADIGNFVDQPVKKYSSGMVLRLAFAVAVSVNPKILVVDEALSVGDELFQRKCFSRMEAIKNSGATILFVSHSGSAVVELCDRAILLDDGELIASGGPKEIVGKYQKLLYAPEDKKELIRKEIMEIHSPQKTPDAKFSFKNISGSQSAEEFFDPNLKPQSTINYESQGAIIDTPQIVNNAGDPVNCLNKRSIYRYSYTVRFLEGASNIRFGMLIKTVSGMELGGAASASTMQNAISYIAPGSLVRVEFRFQCNLNPGAYFLNAGVVGTKNEEETFLHRLLDACMFRVLPCQNNISTGIVDFKCSPEVQILSENQTAADA